MNIRITSGMRSHVVMIFAHSAFDAERHPGRHHHQFVDRDAQLQFPQLVGIRAPGPLNGG